MSEPGSGSESGAGKAPDRRAAARKRAAVDRAAATEGATAARPPAGRQASGRRRSLDPQGRRALFETPVSAARDTIRSGPASEGKAALYSTGPRQPGTVVVSCSDCGARTRINLTDLGLRWLTGSAWLPGRRNSHWMRCPSCTKRTWCAVAWQE